MDDATTERQRIADMMRARREGAPLRTVSTAEAIMDPTNPQPPQSNDNEKL